ncbi:MAG: hypothetical protein E6J34_16170 [Chloroflexi bacterium]|nr:MAG: hypothetical protein E6J34_16170 [Chloroflexota bacterium]
MSVSELQDALRVGQATVAELWNYNAKDWVTSLHAADIDNDGDIEIIASSRDGRVRALTRRGDVRWERIVGSKAWIGTSISISSAEARESRVRVLVGARDGKLYALDKDGKTVTPDGKYYAFDRQGREKELSAYWYKSAQVIRQVALTTSGDGQRTILFGSEDRCVYALDYLTGALRWTFTTEDCVRTIFVCDINHDGQDEVLIGSGDKHLYILDSHGQPLAQHHLKRQIRTLFAADIDHDGQVEILVGTDNKDLVVLASDFTEKWVYSFDNRVLSLYVADIDGDGQAEIIVGTEDKHLYFLDQHGYLIWRYYFAYRIFSIYALDFDNDGVIEVLVGSEDNRVHALRVRLLRNLIKKIRRYYLALGKPNPDMLRELSSTERALLLDIAQDLLAAGHYQDALAALLRLEEQKVQLLWSKEKVGHIRTLYLGDIAGDPKREVIIGNTEGRLQAFNHTGKTLWTLQLGGQILELQTGYLNRGRWQEILACSSDHHVYVISWTKKQIKPVFVDAWMSSIYLTAPDRRHPAEIIVGTEDKKICIYEDGFDGPRQTIDTPQGISIVCAHPAPSGLSREGFLAAGSRGVAPGGVSGVSPDASSLPAPEGDAQKNLPLKAPSRGAQVPEIIAGSLENAVYGYTRSGTLLWQYDTRDRVCDICIKDIDQDGQLEIIVGSEDRNVHVITSDGKQKWRYYTPHRVLAVEAFDLNQDGQHELLVGCGDGYMYVLSASGDLLWRYQANDRVRIIRVDDIDEDGNVEIALGTEDRLELLRVVNQHHLRQLIDQCWSALLQQSTTSLDSLLIELLRQSDPFLRAFALCRYAERTQFSAQDFYLLEEFIKDSTIIVRKALLQAVMSRYLMSQSHVRQILNLLSMDQEQEVRIAFIANIHILIRNDWNLGCEYLEGFSRNIDRQVRRAFVRKLDQLIDEFPEKRHTIFDLLLIAVHDELSQWVGQEATHALAHFLDRHYEHLIPYLYQLIAEGLKPQMLDYIPQYAKTVVVRNTLQAVIPLLADLHEHNVLERVAYAATTFAELHTLEYGKETWMIYEELRRLLFTSSIDDIAHYQCSRSFMQMAPANEYARVMMRIIARLGTVIQILRIYLQRGTLNDQLNALLDALRAIDLIHQFVEREYPLDIDGESIADLPDHRIFELLLKRWRMIIETQLSELRGQPEMTAELQTCVVRREEQVTLVLALSNKGRGAAHNIKVTLLDSADFNVVQQRSFETEVLFSQERIPAEFCIQPRTSAPTVNLCFEIVYYEKITPVDNDIFMKMQLHETSLEFQQPPKIFKHIPNPYSTGTPTYGHDMFYGRKKDVAVLRDNLTRTAAKTVIVLYGQRRSGKTTLLRHLLHSSVLAEHIPILIDMQQEALRIGVSKFLYRIAFRIFQAASKKGLQLQAPAQQDFTDDPTLTFDLFLDTIEEQLTDQKIILLLDEFEVLEEKVKKGQLEPEIFAYLRSLIQHRDSLNFLLSGTHKIEQMTRGYWSVFFNIALHYPLRRLNPEDAQDLITKPVAETLEYEAHAMTKIRHLTGDQPYLIHLMCRSLIDYCNELQKAYVTINDVNTVQHEVMQTGQFHFGWLWEQITDEERVVLSAIAEARKEETRLIALSEIEQIYRAYHIPFKRERVLTAIKALLDADVVEGILDAVAEEPHYRIPVGLIGKWLRQEKPLEIVSRDLA